MFPGLKAMLNYHPLFVHFPIALWLAALLYEVLSVWRARDDWHRTAIRLLYLGTLGAVAAAASGFLAQSSVPLIGLVADVLEIHETIMLITTSLSLALCILCYAKRGDFTAGLRRIFLAGLIALAILTAVGADRGSQLVYQYATSVNLPTPK
ncbi:MAG TPA: DUF2231 domain-containing protein [Candidatus Acidoferrum sp.]|nr:DUF2231 domain-containing protein [Candidatus Acidoferrum sp.]